MKPTEGSPVNQMGHGVDYDLMDPYSAGQIRIITLRRKGNAPLGFSIRGGWEHGTGVFVSEVQPGSVAHMHGLCVGDQIIRVNGFSIQCAIHNEVLCLLRTSPGVVLKVKSMGMIPVKDKKKDPLRWKIVDPGPSPPSAGEESSRGSDSSESSSGIIKVNILASGATSLGCSIAKGPPEFPGIFMCTLKKGGLAESAGLEVGDQILGMNGINFHEIKLADAVSLMKSSKELSLSVKKGAGLFLFSHDASSCQNPSVYSSQDSQKYQSLVKKREKQGMKSPHTNGHDHTNGRYPFEDGSLKNSMVSTSSSESDREYSLVEIKDGMGKINGIDADRNGMGREAEHCKDVWKRDCRMPSDVVRLAKNDHTRREEWLDEESRRLAEQQRRLAEEKESIEKEKRKLEEKKRLQIATDCSPRGDFLAELQKVAANMKEKAKSEDGILTMRTSDVGLRKDLVKQGPEKKKTTEDVIKRKQHEMLMEEFRQAHRKMFGQQDSRVEGLQMRNSFALSSKAPSVKPKSYSASQIDIAAMNLDKHEVTANGQSRVTRRQHDMSSHEQFPRTVHDPTTDFSSEENNIIMPPVMFRVTYDPKCSSQNFQERAGREVPYNGMKPPPEPSPSALVEISPWNTRL